MAASRAQVPSRPPARARVLPPYAGLTARPPLRFPRFTLAAPMRFTTFQSIRDKTPVTFEGWDSFAELFELQVVESKHSVPLYCPAEYINERRLMENVLHVCFGVIDVDKYPEEAVLDALHNLTENESENPLNLKVIFHTTHSHGAGLLEGYYKCRIIIPFSRPVEMHEWDRVWAGMNELVGGIADTQCRNPNAIYYFPSCPKAHEHLAMVEVINPGGEALDIDDVLATAPEVKPRDSFIPEVDPEVIKRIETTTRFKLTQVFLEEYPPAIQGEHGDVQTLKAAMIGGDFGLNDEQFWPLLQAYNERCQPPWDEADLAQKLDNANNYRRLPFGWRLIQQGQEDVVEEKHVKKLAERLAKKEGRSGIVGRRLEKILKGDPIGAEAEQVFESVADCLARHYPHASPSALATLLEKSIKATNTAGNHDITEDFVAERIKEAQEKYHAGRADEQLERQLLERLTIRDAFLSVKQERTTPYTKSEIAGFAEDAGLDNPVEFRRRWILRSGRTFYFFVGGAYVRRTQEEALNSAHELLLPAKLPMYRDTQMGPVPLKLNELMERYGSVADKIYVDLTAQSTHYDWQNKTIIEAPCPFRELEPEHNEYVEKWLRSITEDDVLHGRLLDWLATVPNISRPSCALFLYGTPDSGKSLLPAKLARLWREYGGATDLESLATNFNEEMQACPIVFGDEFVPKDFRGDPRTDLLRKLIQEHDRTLRRKHIADAKLLGAIRMIIAANSPDIIVTEHKSLTNDDIDAINERFLCIRMHPRARTYLRYLKKDKMDDPKVSAIFHGDAIPKHIWWLNKNRDVPDNDRLIVSGLEDSELGLRLMVGAGLRSEVCNWLATYILQDDNKRNMSAKGVRPIIQTGHDGTSRLLVSSHILHTLWTSVLKDAHEKPKIGSIRKALGGVCDSRTTTRIDGKHHAVRTVDLLRVKYWALVNGKCSEETFDEHCAKLGLEAPEIDDQLLNDDE